MSSPTTSETLANAISSQDWEAGLTRSDRPDGLMKTMYGPVVVPANLSARQAKEAGLLTSGTYGLRSTGSSASDALSESLASRLRQKTDLLGSTLFKLTWKVRATPQGRSICALRASALRTSGKDCTGWPTPCQQDGPNGGPSQGADRLPGAASLTGWPTPVVNDETGSTHCYGPKTADGSERKRYLKLPGAASLTGWPTPNAMPPNRGGLQSNPEKALQRREQGHQLNLDDAACLTVSPRATPTTRDHKDGDCLEQLAAGTVPVNSLLGRQALLAALTTPRANKWGFPDAHGSHEAPLAPWITPQTHDTTTRGNTNADHHYSPHDLSNQALLASWNSPGASDGDGGKGPRSGVSMTGRMPDGSKVTLGLSAQVKLGLLTATGATPSGSPASTAKRGQLNPSMSRWLMGFPPEWDLCAPTPAKKPRGK